ncbi:unnamed protein product [Oikopleura dioica]|uniref:Uncharacterized protein n=1 Tax=Oikopleura dioica TaxID=34765 RepID=E4XQZ0_OIKDI|nr:unnamed protein product [Oikopleura dioica]
MIVEGKSALDAVKQNMRGPYGFLLNRQRPQSEANNTRFFRTYQSRLNMYHRKRYN